MSRLLVVTPAELTRDPRARRAASAAQKLGFGVVGLCGQISGETPVSLANISVVRVGPIGRTNPQWKTGGGARNESPWKRELRGVYRLIRLAARTRQLLRGGRQWGGVAVVHAHDFATLPAAALLARESGARLVYDAHELYADFEPDPPRVYRALASRLEGALARKADAVITVSEPIAGELERRFHLRRSPYVVLNAPELDEREPPEAQAKGPLRVIYQGAFGTGRPLEDLLDAIRLAPGVALTLRVPRADPAALRDALSQWNLDGRVDVAEPLPPDELIPALHPFEVGVVFDRPLTMSAELSLPNKLFEYLMAGLAVVAPRLPGLAEIVEASGAGIMYEPGRPEALAEVLEGLSGDRARVAELRRNARIAARGRLNAEAQRDALARAWGR